MLPEDTKCKVVGPAMDVKCKIDTDAGANVIQIFTFRKLCPAMFDSSRNPLRYSMQIQQLQHPMVVASSSNLG